MIGWGGEDVGTVTGNKPWPSSEYLNLTGTLHPSYRFRATDSHRKTRQSH